METTDFEKWLEDVCFEQNPTVLDDDMPDFFDDWIGNLSGEDFIAYANKYSKQDHHTIYTALRGGIEERAYIVREVYSTQMEERVHRIQELDNILTLLDELFGVSK